MCSGTKTDSNSTQKCSLLSRSSVFPSFEIFLLLEGQVALTTQCGRSGLFARECVFAKKNTGVAYPFIHCDSRHAELCVRAWLTMLKGTQQRSHTALVKLAFLRRKPQKYKILHLLLFLNSAQPLQATRKKCVFCIPGFQESLQE